jgi:hypothetical protein
MSAAGERGDGGIDEHERRNSRIIRSLTGPNHDGVAHEAGDNRAEEAGDDREI